MKSPKQKSLGWSRFKQGDEVLIKGIVRGVTNKAYLNVEIEDHICQMNVVTMLIHCQALSPVSRAARKRRGK